MKIHRVAISSLLGCLGISFVGITQSQAQSLCTLSSSDCAIIYEATPNGAKLSYQLNVIDKFPNGSSTSKPPDIQEVNVPTTPDPASLSYGIFTNSAPTNLNFLQQGLSVQKRGQLQIPYNETPKNVLITTAYSRADLQLGRTLIWTKPATQVALARGNNCSQQKNLYEPLQPLPGDPSLALCLISGSVLVITPPIPNQPEINVVTDEGTVLTPGTIYLVNRDFKTKRTEVFVFSSSGAAKVMMPNGQMMPNSQQSCVFPPQAPTALNPQTSPAPECRFRIDAGEYVTLTKEKGFEGPKPFDLPAWVATDPFFAPFRENPNSGSLNELSAKLFNQTAVATSLTDMPMRLGQNPNANLTVNSLSLVKAAEPGLINAVSSQSTDCPVDVSIPNFKVTNPNLPDAENLAPEIYTNIVVPTAPPPSPVRGLW